MKTFISALALVFCATLAGSCKKKDKDPEPQPDPVKLGAIYIKIRTYDSLGAEVATPAGVKVSLVEDNVSATTDASGEVTFSNLAYGYHTPVITREGYDGPLLTIFLQNPEYHASVPIARYSPFKPTNMKADIFGPGSIFLSFTLDPALPAGDSLQLAVVASVAPDLSERKFQSLDLIKVTTTKVTDYQIGTLPEFKELVKGLDSAATFYVSAVPLSYGLYHSNLQNDPQLLGHTQEFPGYVTLKKSWKN